MKTKKIINLLMLFFLPGVLIEISYILFVNLTDSLSLPNLNAIALSAVFVMLPVMLLIMALVNKKETGNFSLENTVKYKSTLPIKKYLIFIPLLLIFFALVFAIGKPLDDFLKERFFSFIPNRYILQINTANHTKSQLIITFLSAFLITGIIAPIIEEIYFRGFLLPRMEWMGNYAPIVNAVLFSVYHFWSPWQIPVRIIALIPFCYLAYKTKNIKITIIAHCLLNVLGDSIGLLIYIIGM